MNRFIGDFKGKKVLVMGLGLHGGGVGTVEFLARHGAAVTVTDLRSRRELAPSLRLLAGYKGIHYVLGRHRKEDFSRTDLVVKNPGVRSDNSFLGEAQKHGIAITSDINIFFRLCPGRIIGVTGTRGKSTATYLIWKFLKSKYPRTHYGGNIRRSALSILPRIRKGDWVVLELSSFQLQDLAMERKSPDIAVLTNILNDHLNWHRNRREYVAAKQAIFRYQRKVDHLFISRGDAAVERASRQAPSQRHSVVLPRELGRVVDENLGRHYRSAAALAVAVGQHLNVSMRKMQKILGAFRGLESRQEEIAVIRGVRFINDTTATIPDAAIAAIARFRARAGRRRLILIAGGQDKKLDFRPMATMIKNHVNTLILLPGTATKKFRRNLQPTTYNLQANKLEIQRASSMKMAVDLAQRRARKGDYIVLSPGAASFGLFLNEFDRGRQFTDAVRRLKTLNPVRAKTFAVTS